MEKPSTKDVQNFVAGALALMGLSAVIRLPHDLIAGSEIGVPIASSIAALTLPLAIGILMRSRLALRLTQLYLWLFVVLGWIVVGMLVWILPWQRLYSSWGVFIRSVVLVTVLLAAFWRMKSAER